jgi:CheY-like chemotaxis protein
MNVTAASSSARILLIDDNNHGLVARKTVLEELGYRITTASSAHEALGYLAESRFDLIITDYKMPRMNGVELIQKVRNEDPSLPVILLSGFADALGLDEKNTGADIVIQKSANEVAHMVRSVGRLLRRKVPKKPAGTQQAPPKVKRKTV